REHSGASLGGRQAPHLRRLLLDQRGKHVPSPKGGVLHGRGGWPDQADYPVSRSCRRAPGTLQRQYSRGRGLQQSTRPPYGGRTTEEMSRSVDGPVASQVI